MPSTIPPTTIRFTVDDRKILDKLEKLTGLNTSNVIRVAIREALAAREAKGKR